MKDPLVSCRKLGCLNGQIYSPRWASWTARWQQAEAAHDRSRFGPFSWSPAGHALWAELDTLGREWLPCPRCNGEGRVIEPAVLAAMAYGGA